MKRQIPWMRLPLAVLWTLGLMAAACSNNGGTTGTQTAAGSGFNLPGSKDGFGGGLGSDVQAPKADVVKAEDDAAAGTDSSPEDAEQPGSDAEVPVDAEPGPQDGDPGTDDAQAGTDDAEPGTDAETPADAEPACLTDDDGDGYGLGCPNGEDCDDMNPNFTVTCPDCSKPGVPGCLCKATEKPVSCYSGDPATKGKGVCAPGNYLCKNGFWSECMGEVMPDPEKCDSKDNDCDGETDEGVKSSCGTCDLTCNEQKIGATSASKWNLNSENSTGLGLDPMGNVVLDASQISLNLKFLWASNSPENTVSKVDCKTVKEVGRYSVCTDPSRTSVDLDGNVFVACRGDARVAKIAAETKECIDKNGNGKIDTSSDLNGDGNIQPNEMVANDECVLFIVQPLGPGSSGAVARGAAVDKFNNVYIGFWNQGKVAYVDGKTGATLKTIDWQCGTYGLVVDQKGNLWGQGSLCGGLMMYNPNDDKWFKMATYSQVGISPYGINVDGAGRVWLGGSPVSRYNPATMTWLKCQTSCAGLATSNNGIVFLAKDGGGIGKIDGETCQDLGTVKVDSHAPHGVAIDYDGFVWGVNWSGGSTVDKVDPGPANGKIGNVIGTRSIGNNPYTYSDMTGYTLNYFTAPKGQYSTVFFGGLTYNPVATTQPKQVWQTISAEADLPEGTALRIRLRAGNTKTELEAAKWSEPIDFPPALFPYNVATLGIVGNLLQVEVGLTTKDKKISPVLKALSAKSKLM